MIYLIIGVVIFFSVHAVPSLPVKQAMIQRVGLGPYKGLFSLLSALGLGLLIFGKGHAPFIELWQPPVWGRHITMLLMMFTVLMLVAYLIPNNLRKLIRHPMLIAILLWSLSHLLANGDLSSAILFGSFGLFAVIDMVAVNKRSDFVKPKDVSHLFDGLTVIVAGLVYGLFFIFHRNITGMPLI
ncbi:hypothetical protein A9Q99_25155 [Gammaproteobacteria bacterium 45_16_T64]|nr:hypothetical protein A9Q99_25155 [Gammaproteobacteria bacterium 45_16_T64]